MPQSHGADGVEFPRFVDTVSTEAGELQIGGALGVATDCPGAPGRGAVEKRGEFATEFDRVHSVERAVRTGSVST